MSRLNLRGRKAAIVSLPDVEIPEISSQLARIGISVSVRTNPDVDDLLDFDFVFLLLTEAAGRPIHPICETKSEKRPICVVILESETPTLLEHLEQVDADAVIIKPIRPLGLLAIMSHAQSRRAKTRELADKIARLERKLIGVRNVESAKATLAARHKTSPDKAFAMLRKLAMQERVTVEQVAETIVSANRLLSVMIEPKRTAKKR